MSDFRELTIDELRAVVDDDYVQLCMGKDAFAVSNGSSWGASHHWMQPWRRGGFITGDDLDGVYAALSEAGERREQPLEWCSFPLGGPEPAALRGLQGGQWDLMTCRTMSEDRAPSSARIVEIDSDAHAEELNGFGLRINPTFEGEAGTGVALFWLVIRDDNGQLQGCIACNRFNTGVPHLAGLVVDPELRGKGMGRALMAAATRRAIDEHGVCTLGVYHDNHHAIALYKGLGYTTTHAFDTRSLRGTA